MSGHGIDHHSVYCYGWYQGCSAHRYHPIDCFVGWSYSHYCDHFVYFWELYQLATKRMVTSLAGNSLESGFERADDFWEYLYHGSALESMYVRIGSNGRSTISFNPRCKSRKKFTRYIALGQCSGTDHIGYF